MMQALADGLFGQSADVLPFSASEPSKGEKDATADNLIMAGAHLDNGRGTSKSELVGGTGWDRDARIVSRKFEALCEGSKHG